MLIQNYTNTDNLIYKSPTKAQMTNINENSNWLKWKENNSAFLLASRQAQGLLFTQLLVL